MKRWLWILGGLLIAGLVFATKAFWEPQTTPEVVPEAPQVSHNIRVEILNGCGTGGIANEIGAKTARFWHRCHDPGQC